MDKGWTRHEAGAEQRADTRGGGDHPTRDNTLTTQPCDPEGTAAATEGGVPGMISYTPEDNTQWRARQ